MFINTWLNLKIYRIQESKLLLVLRDMTHNRTENQVVSGLIKLKI